MIIGSKVRMLHGQGEGIVTKINGDQVIVLLNEGLEIPFHKRDLVQIAVREEQKEIAKADPKSIPMLRPQVNRFFFVKEGVFLAGFEHDAMLMDFSVVNHTDFELFVIIYQISKPSSKFIQTLSVPPKSVEPLQESFPIKGSNHVVGLVFQVVKFHPDQGEATPASEFRFSFSQIDWKKTIAKIPILEKQGYLLQMDADSPKIDVNALKDRLSGETKPPAPKIALTPKYIEFREVDLHIEKLTSDFNNLSASQMLDIQISSFEKAFDKAVLDNVRKLILIHGIGNGVLKNEIHRRLAKSPQIKHFKDAMKEKFGYGATEVEF